MSMTNKIALGTFAIATLLQTSFATDARIESMGKNSNFIMDDISIYDNPANIGIYPNYLIGEMGSFRTNPEVGKNLDPQNPYFGGIFSIGLGEDKFRDPRFSIGGALNRKDEILNYLPNYVMVKTQDGKNLDTLVAVPSPVTNFDGFLGLSSKNGNLYGLHIYTAMQSGADNQYNVEERAYAAVMNIDGGVNFQLNEDVDWEISAGLSRIDFGNSTDDFFDPSLFGVFAKMRMFSTLEIINGELVPHGEFRYTTMDGRDFSHFTLGLGVNVAMDRGFFWLGLEYFDDEDQTSGWHKMNNSNGEVVYVDQTGTDEGFDRRTETGAVISFGIERNIWWDWFVVRVGGKKVMSYVECKVPNTEESAIGFCGEEGNYYYTNPTGNGTENDHVGFGVGINIEEKLKVDLTMAEDVLYRNPFQGSGRLISRLSATYAF